MPVSPRIRKLLLTSHITFSVGWIGAVAAFLALSVVASSSANPEVIRGNYIAMDVISRLIIIPMSFAALATGLTQALSSEWGLFRYYWIATKFGLAILATIALLIHQFAAVAAAAQRVSRAGANFLLGVDMEPLRIELVRAPALALVVLLIAVSLAVYKPWGLTRYGQRQRQIASKRPSNTQAPVPWGVKVFIGVLLLLLGAFVVLHLTGGGFAHHGT